MDIHFLTSFYCPQCFQISIHFFFSFHYFGVSFPRSLSGLTPNPPPLPLLSNCRPCFSYTFIIFFHVSLQSTFVPLNTLTSIPHFLILVSYTYFLSYSLRRSYMSLANYTHLCVKFIINFHTCRSVDLYSTLPRTCSYLLSLILRKRSSVSSFLLQSPSLPKFYSPCFFIPFFMVQSHDFHIPVLIFFLLLIPV